MTRHKAARPQRRRAFITPAVQEIRWLQRTYHLVVPALPLARLIRQVTHEYAPSKDLRFGATALLAIHEAAEAYLTALFADSALATLHATRATVLVRDMQLARRLRGLVDVAGNYTR